MITIEQLANNNIPVNISYGWTSDYRTTIERICNLHAHEGRKLVCIQGASLYFIQNDGTIANGPDIQPDANELLANCIAGNNAVSGTLIFVLGKQKQIAPVAKTYYDTCTHYILDQGTRGGNLISSENDIGRAMGVEDRPTQRTQVVRPRIIMIGHSADLPNGLEKSVFNLGCIDMKASKSDPITSGLNTAESIYLKEMLNHIEGKAKQWQNVATLRKGVFSSSKAIRDISITEDVKNIGGYEKVKKYYKFRKEYIQKEKGMLKISGDLFVGPPGTGKSRILTAIPQMLGLPGFELDLNAALGSLQGQSEQAVIEAIEQAKKLAPVVVLLDEVEKMIAGVGEGQVAGNEVAEKIFGILLTAMAQKNGIYWVASANRVDHLPAPFKRKGRFNNMWHVPMPTPTIRAKIFGIHCRLNGIDIKNIDVDSIINSMAGWTGAEIEHVCIESAVKAIATGEKPTTESIQWEVRHVKGVSGNEKVVKDLEIWAKENALPVD